jgi:hypothetical protein
VPHSIEQARHSSQRTNWGMPMPHGNPGSTAVARTLTIFEHQPDNSGNDLDHAGADQGHAATDQDHPGSRSGSLSRGQPIYKDGHLL